MNKNIENIQNNFEVSHCSTISDGTLHTHNYFEVELIENGKGTQVINDQTFNISRNCISIFRPLLDKQSLTSQDTEIFDHNISFESKKNYKIQLGAIHIIDGENAGKLYIFLKIEDNIIAEKILDEPFSCKGISFYAKYSSKNINISQNLVKNLDFSKSKILLKNDVFSPIDNLSNNDFNLPDNLIISHDDMPIYKYNRNGINSLRSFVFNCNLNIEAIVYRLITMKLIGENKEIDFLISTDKIYFSQVSPQYEFDIYKLCINQNLVNMETKKALLSIKDPLCTILSDETFENVKRIFELLIYFNRKNNTVDNTILNLIDVLFKLYFSDTNQRNNSNPFQENIYMFFLDNNRFLSDITLKDFANYLGYDSGYASRLCLKVTGSSFVKYKIYLRLQYAKNLILTTNLPISEIATKSSFNSLSVFNRFFKKETGMNPSLYRSLHKKKTK